MDHDDNSRRRTSDDDDELLQPTMIIRGNPSQTILCTKFSLDGKYIATGNLDGTIHCYNRYTGDLAYIMEHTSFHKKSPVTALKFRPEEFSSCKTKNVLVTTDTSGRIIHWHATSGTPMYTIQEPNCNQIYAFDYNRDATSFATGGKDAIIRIYDESTKKCSSELKRQLSSSQSDLYPSGHSNRIYCLKFHPENNHVLLSGGWDNIVYMWDIRASNTRAQRCIISPHICGNDSVDMKGNLIVTGSSRNQQEDAVELWDYGSGLRLTSLNIFDDNTRDEDCMVYSAQFSKAATNTKINHNDSSHSPVTIAAGGGYSGGTTTTTSSTNDNTYNDPRSPSVLKLSSSIHQINTDSKMNSNDEHSNVKLINCIPQKQNQQNCGISTLDFSPVESTLAVAMGSDIHIVPW